MTNLLHRALWAAAAAVLAALALASSAQAAVTCDYAQSGKFLEVRITESNELVTVDVLNGTIRAFDYITPSTCTSNPPGLTPTVTNTDVIAIAAEAGVKNTTLIIDNAPAFAPGATAEAGTSEIEIFANLNDSQDSLLSVRNATTPASFRLGTSGIDTNATPAQVQPDIDITPLNVGDIDLRSGCPIGSNSPLCYSQPSSYDASGGGATGGSWPKPIEITANRAADTLVGGGGDDRLYASDGPDVLRGNAGDDDLLPGLGDDTVDGGPGTDLADYFFTGLPTGVVVDLARSGPQPTGGGGADSFTGVENLRGTQFTDILSGDAGRNDIEGGAGPDFVDGRGGADTISTFTGNDTITARDGVADTVDCGDGVDTVTADARGVDTLTGCENVDFATTPGGGGGGGAGGGGGGAGGGGGGAAQPPVVRPLVVTPAAFAARTSGATLRPAAGRVRGALVAFAVDRAATVTFRVVRIAPGRRAGGRCVAPARARRAAPRCTRVLAVRGSVARAATAGANRLAFSGRVGGKALAPGRYRLLAVARAGGLAGPPARAAFRILP
ncbi:MAG: calcium-binding protein [Thermoleophilia bacterium]